MKSDKYHNNISLVINMLKAKARARARKGKKRIFSDINRKSDGMLFLIIYRTKIMGYIPKKITFALCVSTIFI
jgi:hypothetical protein